jgi:hypothetical protein
MLRQFTKDIGRFERGEVKDYPKPTWDQMAVNAGQPLEKFTAAISNPGDLGDAVTASKFLTPPSRTLRNAAKRAAAGEEVVVREPAASSKKAKPKLKSKRTSH